MTDVELVFLIGVGFAVVASLISIMAVDQVRKKPHIADHDPHDSIDIDISNLTASGGGGNTTYMPTVISGTYGTTNIGIKSVSSTTGQLYLSGSGGWTSPWTPIGTVSPGGTFTTTTSFSGGMLSMKTTESGDLHLPERDDDEPIGAFKAASLCLVPGVGLTLCSLNDGIPHERIAEAKCRYTSHDVIPALDCGCGFYALKDREEAQGGWGNPNNALLEVELGGRVLVCDNGYRAQWQRILRIELGGGCYYCGEEPVTFALDQNDVPTARCGQHVRSTEIALPTTVIGLPISFDVTSNQTFNGGYHGRGS